MQWDDRGWKPLLRLFVSFRIDGHAGPEKAFYDLIKCLLLATREGWFEAK
jgi:hypothetical protein